MKGTGKDQKVNILLVDDQADSLLAAEAVLSDLGQNLVKARSGPEALRLLLGQTFAVIILDVQMPEMNGFDLATMIRERDSLRYTPIIFLTAIQSGDAQVFKGYAAGAVDYLFKPVQPEILKSKVTAFVELAKKTQLLEETNHRLVLDIAKRREVEEALRASEEKFRSVAETAKDAIISADRYGLVTFFNRQAEQIFGYTSSEIEGRPLTLLMPERYHDAHLKGLRHRLVTGKSRLEGNVIELVGKRKDGGEFPLEISLASWKKGSEVYFSAIIRDITDRKQLEKEILSVSEREQQRFAQDLHDGLFQHLKGIAYMVSTLEKKLVEGGADEAQMAAKIEDLVNQAIVAGRGIARGLSPVSLETNGLMFALNEMASTTSRLYDISCSFECPVPVLMEDNNISLHLFRIAQEAVNNAVKHSKARHIRIGLSSENNQIRLTVKDDGTGFRATAAPSDGGGMGIHIMNYRARMIGATLDVRPDHDAGTIMTCRLHPDATPKSVKSYAYTSAGPAGEQR